MGRRVVGIALLVVGLACATATSIYRAPAYADPQEQTKSILPPDNTDLLESSNYNFSSYCKILTGKDAVPQDEGNMFAQGADSLSATGGGVTKYTCSGIQMPQDQCSSLKGGKPTNGSTCTLEYTATSGVGGNDVDPQVISTMQTLVDASIAQASADAARKPLIDAFCGGLAGSEPGATGPQDYQWCTGTVSQSYDSCNANSGVRSGTLSMGDCVTNAVNTSAAPHNNVSPDAANAALQQGQTDSATTQATQTCAAKTGGAGKWKYDPDSQTCVPADSQACYQAYGSSATWVGNDDDGTGTCTPPQASDNGPVCSVGGLDFLLCPLVNLLTGLNDAFFSNIVSGVLDTSPMLGDSADNIKSAYDKILPIANIVLVIIFLIIVYSTAVGNGSGALSNYNVKKMLPRLIVAAIAMNTAWYICAAAVDISNILGRGLYELIASSAPSIEEGFGWKAMLSTTIAGGVAVAGVGIAAVLMSPEVLILMLLVAALGGFIAFIAGWFTMLLRNVVVTLCVIIAPVAIVAFVLPNTKKWADKWRNIFFTMLAMYPIIAVFTAGALFAGSAMAGSDSMFTKFGGLIVMAAPMFMLPFMVKKTSGVLGTIQDKMTNLGKSVTSKPLGDWVNRNKEGMRDRFQAGDTRLSKMPGFRALSNVGSNLAGRRRTRELRGKNAGTALENEWLNEGTRETKKGHTVFNLNTAAGRAQARMARLANANTAATGAINAATSRMNSKDLKVNARINKNEIRDEVSKGIIEGEKQAQRAGKSVKPKYDLSAEQTESTIRQQAIQTAKGIQAGNYARAVNEKSGDKYTPAAEYLAKIAGMGDARYMSRVRAGAQGIVSKEDQEAATAAAQLFLHDHPQATTADVGQAMEDAVALGEDGTDLARGLSEHLATGMGGAGINQLETSMNTMEAKWVSNPSTLTVDELNRYNAFRANLTGKVPKNKSASLDSASIAPFATVDPGTGKVTIKKTLTQIQGTKETYTRLTTGEKSTLSPDELHRAITADAISYDEAQALLNDSRYSQNLTNDTIKLVNGQNVRERLAAIPAPPTPPTP